MPRLVFSSQFFLDVRPWHVIETEILPSLLSERSSLRAWSAGCHVGKEPYSLAILLSELSPISSHYLLATDRDDALLATARNGGPYTERDVELLSPERRTRYLVPGGPPHYVTEELKAHVTFCKHDLLADSYEATFDIIMFRDIEPFYSLEINSSIYVQLRAALRPGGILFVGSTDSVPGWRDCGFRRIGQCLYTALPSIHRYCHIVHS